ncbi:MAG TPA: hypothetical protein PLB74_02660 [Candidatus Paceibacterota bacterium]|nr:hypothetical protein [Candidatus Paceibacterota bacterium]HOK34897.1 hypothetical protein [Candidatus Paceibacterota bacterium]HOV88930.1 hypothetical protein [Candidatus Paceibacterota bacterium]
MFLTPHFLTGAAITKVVPNKPLAYTLAFFIHFLLDRIPHSDHFLSGISTGRKNKSFYQVVGPIVIDFFVGIALIIIAHFTFDNFALWPAIIGGILGILPDFFNALSYFNYKKNYLLLFKGQPLYPVEEFATQTKNPYYRFHRFFHNEKVYNGILGTITQLAVIIIDLVVLLAL